ncbi:hypothetical protein SAY86_031464 [Trapa natans]|uniref:ABC transporter domain-containing protein n=1 Tax=Trapa natans TaxID=22666 RepID=A0AAN7LR91_TRANT|nr:hypothetical protein SAY86_031464 [Trapa natans]
MMPPEQDRTGAVATPSRTVTNCNQECPVHVEPSSSSCNVLPSHEELLSDDQPLSSLKLPVLQMSLFRVTLRFEDVGYKIKLHGKKRNCCFLSYGPKQTRTILNGVTGMARPGELLAMLGPSGSGKTTLLSALAGRLLGKVNGTITFNGQPFSSSMKRRTGFVSQDDIMYPHLTVLETLTYTALLRLPKELTKEEKVQQVELVIAELGLMKCRNNVVGGPLLRGVSGGERKRVSIGQEMLVNPSLLLLDEPTSGLDSTMAQRIVATIRGLARGGRTVVTTIHQPSSRLYMLFDKVLVLSEGCPIYSGSASQAMEYFGCIGYTPGFNFVNPADFLLDLANGIKPDLKPDDQLEFHMRDRHEDQNTVKQNLTSAYKKHQYPALKAELHQNSMDHVPHGARSSSSTNGEFQWTTSWLDQFKVLLSRGLRERKHESYSGLKIFQVMSVAILSGLLWWRSDPSNIQDQVGLLFFFSIFWGFFPLFNAIFAFPLERPMLNKERSSGMYRLSSYYFARTAGDLPMELVLPTIFVTLSYWMGGLRPSIVTYALTLLIVLFNVLVAQGLGLALGAILMDAKQGTTLASVTMLVFLLAGGYYIQHIPKFMAWLKYISFSHYCYKLLVGVQYSHNKYYACGIGDRCRVLDFPAIEALGLDDKWWDVAALGIMLICYRALAYAALRFGQPH